ncbi:MULTISPECIES: TetR/AcrR family transcriptional regulator [Rathayibacter]|uniref:TetR/AcrR family transcriptional regulator n=1 Tax=Rathayibacter TaxID=33886 RepID=UPI001359DDDF|nr:MULTISPECIES: TetR/AcrR family transcriptional regulator [Rathayibacter]
MSREHLLSTALELLDDVGPDAFSLRELAERLNSGTATLYRHFAGKHEILDLLLDRVFAEIPEHLDASPKDADWLERTRALSVAFFRTLVAHPRAVPLLVEGIPSGPAGLTARESMLAALLPTPFPPDAGARVYTTIAHYVIGFATQVGPSRAATSETPRRPLELDSARFPATTAASPFLAADAEEEFAFGLELILSGLRVLEVRSRSTPPRLQVRAAGGGSTDGEHPVSS